MQLNISNCKQNQNSELKMFRKFMVEIVYPFELLLCTLLTPNFASLFYFFAFASASLIFPTINLAQNRWRTTRIHFGIVMLISITFLVGNLTLSAIASINSSYQLPKELLNTIGFIMYVYSEYVYVDLN